MPNRRWTVWCVALMAVLALNAPGTALAQEAYGEDLPQGVEAISVDGKPVSASVTPQVDTPSPVFAGRLAPGPTEVELAVRQNGDVVRFTLSVAPRTGAFQGEAPDPLRPGTYSLYVDDDLIGEFVVSDAAAPERPLDLPAMVLAPDDVEAGGFGLVYGRLLSLAELAAQLAAEQGDGSPEARARITSDLEAGGWRGQYESRIAAPSATDPAQFAVSITSVVALFADEDAAGADFAAGAAARAEDAVDAPTIADESVMAPVEGVAADTGSPFKGMTAAFRSGAIVGVMTVRDFTNLEPGVGRVQALATTFADRVAAVRAAHEAGLGGKALRLDVGDPEPFPEHDDAYELLGGRAVPRYGESEADLEEAAARHGGATDVFAATSSGEFLAGGSDAEAPDDRYRYIVLLYGFADEDEAAAWMADLPERLAEDRLAGYLRFGPVADAPSLGEGSAAYLLEHADAEARTVGFRIYARVGDEVAQVELTTGSGAQLEAVAEVAAAQVACMEAGACPEPAPVPPSLLEAGADD